MRYNWKKNPQWLKRIKKYLEEIKTLEAFKNRVIADSEKNILPPWHCTYNAVGRYFPKKLKAISEQWIDKFLSVKGNSEKFKEIYESARNDRIEIIIKEFSEYNLGDGNRRKVLARHLNLHSSQRGLYQSWFDEWRKNESEVELFKKMYSDSNVSLDEILNRFPIFNNNRNRTQHAARRLGILSSRVNQHGGKRGIEMKHKELDQISLKAIQKKLLSFLKSNSLTVDELSIKLDISKENVYKIVQMAIDEGYSISHNDSTRLFALLTDFPLSSPEPSQIKVYRNSVKVGLIGNTAIGDINQQMTLLHTVYEIFEKEGVDFAIHTGDLMAGVYPRSKQQNLFIPELNEQIKYVVNYYPRSKKFKTHIIGGLAEISFKKEGINDPLDIICKSRSDLRAHGYGRDDFAVKNALIRVVHPLKKSLGHPYARSYKQQKAAKNIITSMVPELRETGASSRRPQIAVVGRWRTSLYIPSQEGIPIISVPGLNSSTVEDEEFTPDVGALILELFFDSSGNIDQERPPRIIDIKLDAHTKKDDYLVSVEDTSKWNSLNDLEKAMLKILEESVWGNTSIGELSRRMKSTGVSDKTVIRTFKKLIDLGYDLVSTSIGAEIKQIKWKKPKKEIFNPLNLGKIFANEITIGSVSDTHLCSKYQQMTLLDKSYDIGVKEKIDFMIHAGDVSDGPGDIHHRAQGKADEIFLDGATKVWLYCVEKYPSREGIITEVIGGNHDRWWETKLGFDIVDAISRLRSDFKYHGNVADFARKDFSFFVNHPDGAPSYALSYKIQKHIESVVKEAVSKSKVLPHFVAMGNWHVALYFGYMGVAGFCLPCLQEKTPYLQAKGLLPDVGMWIVKLTKDEFGRLTKSVVRYYDFRSMTKEKDY